METNASKEIRLFDVSCRGVFVDWALDRRGRSQLMMHVFVFFLGRGGLPLCSCLRQELFEFIGNRLRQAKFGGRDTGNEITIDDSPDDPVVLLLDAKPWKLLAEPNPIVWIGGLGCEGLAFQSELGIHPSKRP